MRQRASLPSQAREGGNTAAPLERTCQTSLQEQRADEKEDISFSNICRDAAPLETAGVRLRVAGVPLQLGPFISPCVDGDWQASHYIQVVGYCRL